MCPVSRCRHGLRRDPSGSALPTLPQSVSRGTRFSRLHWFATATACQVARPPWTDRTKFPWPTGDFYIQASDGSVTLPVAGYDYNSNWTPLLAGLSPAGMAASLAAPDLPGFPGPGQEFVQAQGRVVRQPRQNVSQPGARVDVIEFGRLDQRVERRCPPPTRVRAGERPIPPPDGNAPDGPFRRIVGQADATVLNKARE